MELSEEQARGWEGEGAVRALLIRLPDDLFEMLQQRSREEGVSMNNLVTRILRRVAHEAGAEGGARSQEATDMLVSSAEEGLPTRVYINYPNPHLTVHGTADGFYRRADSSARFVRITRANKAEELTRFAAGYYAFGASAVLNGMWIEIDLGSFEEEVDLAREIWKRLGARYTRLVPAPFTIHCGA